MEIVSQVPGPSPHDSDALRQGGGMMQYGAEPTGLHMERARESGVPLGCRLFATRWRFLSGVLD